MSIGVQFVLLLETHKRLKSFSVTHIFFLCVRERLIDQYIAAFSTSRKLFRPHERLIKSKPIVVIPVR